MLKHTDWFNAVEALCLTALDDSIDADELIAAVEQIEISTVDGYQPTYNLGEMGPMLFGLSSAEQEETNKVLPFMLNAALTSGLSSFSLWQTAGSERICPVLFSCQGLPPIGGIASMLDGQWQERNWKIPYNIQQV